MKKIKLYILGLSYSQTQTGAYALVLGEEHGDRRIPIIIGAPEAQSIAIQLEGLKPTRPLTHDLFLNFATEFSINLIEVHIYKLEEGIFYSELVCDNGSEVKHIDARTSDAVALALRFKCPVYTTEEIMEKAGIVLDLDESSTGESSAKPPRPRPSESGDGKYADYKLDELQELLQDAISEENYEEASEIRDEIKRREDQDD